MFGSLCVFLYISNTSSVMYFRSLIVSSRSFSVIVLSGVSLIPEGAVSSSVRCDARVHDSDAGLSRSVAALRHTEPLSPVMSNVKPKFAEQ